MVLPSEKPDQEKAADYRTYKYSQLLSVIVKFTIVNDCACQDGGKATRLTADQRIPVRFRVLASWCNHEYQSPENIRSTLRAGRDQGDLPGHSSHGLTVAQETALRQKIAELKGIIADLKTGTGTPKVTKIAGTLDVRSREEQYINIHPIQAAGRLTTEARKALISYGDGYSTCDFCRKPFRLDKIWPGIAEFHEELAKWLNMDQARVVPGARRGFQAVTNTLVNKGDSVIVSALAHYTEFLAVENAGGIVKEVPINDQHIVTAEATAQKIENVKAETGKLPVLVMIDHFDYQYANEHEIPGIGKVAHQYNIPFLYNGAYTVGVRRSTEKRSGLTSWSAPGTRAWHR